MQSNVEVPIRIGIGEPYPIRFSLAFPLGQLVVCALLLWPIRGWIFTELGVPLRFVEFLSLPHETIIAGSARVWSSNNAIRATAMLNLPAGLVQLPYAIFSREHTEFTPPGVDSEIWRAVTWPVLGTFFWWIAGRGAEALAAWRQGSLIPKIRLAEAILGFLLLSFGLVFAGGFLLFGGSDRHDSQLQLAAASSGLWTFLGALPFIAKIMQWRLKKKPSTVS